MQCAPRATLGLFLCLMCLAGCGETGDQRSARDSVDRFYAALKAHDAETACRLVSPAVANAILRESGVVGKPCVSGLETIFGRVGSSQRPNYFASPPKVAAVTVSGDRANAIISRGYNRRHVLLRRVEGGWQITGSPDIH